MSFSPPHRSHTILSVARTLRAIALIVALGLATPAQAILLDGFEGSIGGTWTSVGDVYRVDTSFDPAIPQGNWGLYLSTFPNGTGVGSLTGDPIESPRPSPAVAAAVVESFLGLAGGDLDGISPSGNPATEGSAAQRSFTTTQTMTLSLRFNMLTNETDVWAPTWNDFVFTTLTGEGAVSRADINGHVVAGTLNSSATVFDRETGYLTVTWADLAAGSYTLGVGVVDVQDTDVGTAVVVDQILLVPEPWAACIMGVGLSGIWLVGRPRRR